MNRAEMSKTIADARKSFKESTRSMLGEDEFSEFEVENESTRGLRTLRRSDAEELERGGNSVKIYDRRGIVVVNGRDRYRLVEGKTGSYKVVAVLPDGQRFDDEAHVGEYHSGGMSKEEADNAVYNLNMDRPDGFDDVEFEVEKESCRSKVTEAFEQKPIERVEIEIFSDQPDLFFDEDGMVRLAAGIGDVFERESDIMKRCGIDFSAHITTASGDWEAGFGFLLKESVDEDGAYGESREFLRDGTGPHGRGGGPGGGKAVCREGSFTEAVSGGVVVSGSTGIPQQGAKGKSSGRVYGVSFNGVSLMATTDDPQRAMKVAQGVASKSKKEIAFWDGDKGVFVDSLEDLKESCRRRPVKEATFPLEDGTGTVQQMPDGTFHAVYRKDGMTHRNYEHKTYDSARREVERAGVKFVEGNSPGQDTAACKEGRAGGVETKQIVLIVLSQGMLEQVVTFENTAAGEKAAEEAFMEMCSEYGDLSEEELEEAVEEQGYSGDGVDIYWAVSGQ